MSPLDFIKLVKAQADVINVHGGRAGYHPGLYKQHLKIWMEQKGETGEASAETIEQATETICEEYLACYVIRAVHKEKYESLKNELDNDFLKGKDTYPKKMEEALRLLQNHKGGKQGPDFDSAHEAFEDDNVEPPLELNDDPVVYEGEDEASESDSDNEDEEDPEPRRYPKRNRKKKEPTVIDYKNKAYKIRDGVIHLNPAVFETDPGPIYPEYVEKPNPLSQKEATIRILGVIMLQQYGIKKGIKLFGDKGKEAVTKELTQLHDHVTYVPVHSHELTREQKKEALESLIFLTKKRCGRVKARACANGSKQRSYIRKESAISPMVGTDSVFITSVIEAHKGRRVVKLDIPGAFLHADTDEMVHMLLRGELAELMVKVDPAMYRPYITKNARGESVMFVKMQKAMYGMLRSSLLFYQKLVDDLETFGFELNPYDPCVANKMVNGEQMTLTWHVDDLK
eukprot:CCRYP_017126-RA/>CCRYP_017126-RA protein AED:0.35 eAED:0.30 QI:0/0/0/1/1/1/2/0/455